MLNLGSHVPDFGISVPTVYTDADLAAVRAALVRGEAEVQFSDRRVRYRGVDELLKLEARIVGELGAANQRPRQIQCVTDKGFC